MEKTGAEEIKNKQIELAKNNSNIISTQFKKKVYENFGILVSPIGEQFIKIDCISSFAENYNINKEGIRRVLLKKRKSHKGWKLSY